MEMDLGTFRLIMLSNEFEDISSGLEKFDNQECHFFYDESNNIRKLWLDENGFNASVDSDFVLGGVMHFGKTCNAYVDALKNELRLQKSAEEMKFMHISKGKDFFECLSEPKVNLFLHWLSQSDLYVHFSNINNLYWAIVDIVDTIDEAAYMPFNFQMKNELYKIAEANYLDFCQLLIRCNFPNVTGGNIELFYQGIIDLIDHVSGERSFDLEFLRQGMKTARKQKELVFLRGNTERTVLDSYFDFYLRPIGVFSAAQHIFDNEYQIEKQFSEYELTHNGKRVDNYCFVNSKDNTLIQVSDCVVGLLAKYYTFINRIGINDAYQMFGVITPEQKSTLKLFVQLIKNSEYLSKLLINSVESIGKRDISEYILMDMFS
jgi:hypothetical protein